MVASGVDLKHVAAASQDNPDAGRSRLSVDPTTKVPYVIDEAGNVTVWSAVGPKPIVETTGAQDVDGNLNNQILEVAVNGTLTFKAGVAVGTFLWIVAKSSTVLGVLSPEVGTQLITEIGNISNGSTVRFEGQSNRLFCYVNSDQDWVVSGKVSNAELPNLFSDLMCWYDFTDPSGTDAINTLDPITNIFDKGPLGNDLTQALAANKARIEFSTTPNGLRSAWFDGGDFYAFLAGMLDIAEGDNTIYAVFRQPTEVDGEAIVGGQANQWRWGLETVTGKLNYHNSGEILEGPDRDLTQWNIVVGIRNGASLSIYNGFSLTGTDQTATDIGQSAASIGMRGDNPASGIEAYIAHIAIYRQAHDNTERALLTAFFNNSIGL